MDVCELKIAKERAKCLERENADLDAKLNSQVDDLKESIKTIKHL